MLDKQCGRLGAGPSSQRPTVSRDISRIARRFYNTFKKNNWF